MRWTLTILCGILASAAVAAGRCPDCLDTGKVMCPDCRVSGKATGKIRCAMCGGKRRVTCPDCGGTRGFACTACGGRGQIVGGTARRYPGAAPETVYKPCRRCGGTGAMHKDKDGSTRSGPCPRCNERGLPTRLLGTIRCPSCNGTGYSGPCPTCKGTKFIPCPRCVKAATRPTTQPTTRPTWPPALPTTFTSDAAKAAATAYAEGVEKAEAQYAKALREIQDARRTTLATLVAAAVKALGAAMVEATRSGDLDEAIKIRDAAAVLSAQDKTTRPQ